MRAQFGEALVLAGGSDSHPQFLQPVLKNLGEVKAFNITETDHLMAANRHVLKLADKATPETALYGLRTRGQAHEAVRELPLNRSARCKGAAQVAPATTINLQKYDRGRPNRDVGVRAHHRPIDKPLIGRQAESAICLVDHLRGRVGPGNCTLSPSQIPYVNLSIHTARVTA